MMTKHILVPLDFSESSDAALSYAIDLTSRLRAHLTLCHVIPNLPFSEARLLSPIVEVEDVARLALEDRCERAQHRGVAAHPVLVCGDPWQQIVETAMTRQVDLVIMATHGYTGLQEALLGSVAIRVLNAAPCSVCVIPPPSAAPDTSETL